MSKINNCQTVMYFPGSFFIDFLSCSDCQMLKLFTKLFSILLTHYCINILHNMCPEIIMLSTLTNNCSTLDMINDYLQENTWCRMFFPLNTTWKGKLINPIELKLSNAFYICLNTCSKLSLSNILNINFDSY